MIVIIQVAVRLGAWRLQLLRRQANGFNSELHDERAAYEAAACCRCRCSCSCES